MEFAGSNLLVPILLIVATSSFIAFEIRRRTSLKNRRGHAGRQHGRSHRRDGRQPAAKRSLFGSQVEAEPAAEEITAWHRQFEQAVYSWFELTEAAIAQQQAGSLRPALEAVAAPEPADLETANQSFQQAAQSHPSPTKQTELLEMYNLAQSVMQALPDSQPAAASKPATSDLLADYRSLRDVWLERLRQISLDDTFALKLLAIQRR